MNAVLDCRDAVRDCSRNAWVFKWLEDREHERPGSWHWHLIAERLT